MSTTAYLITKEEIESTKTFNDLEQYSKNILLRLSSKKDISYGIVSYRSTGVVPGSVSGNNLRVLKELIQKENLNKT